MKIKCALISVYDKTGVVNLARELRKLGIGIIATSGTAKILEEGGINCVKKVSDVTEFPEILEGRVKTEHPRVIGGILALRNRKEHMMELKRLGIQLVDMVICNLYPFADAVNRDIDLKSASNNIDIGGPNMIRAAAKNFKNVVVVVNPRRYDQIISELSKKGDISMETRLLLATEAFRLTAKYDQAIYRFLEERLETV